MPSPWLKRTRQGWKIAVFTVLLLCGLVLFALMTAAINAKSDNMVEVIFAFVGMTFGACDR